MDRLPELLVAAGIFVFFGAGAVWMLASVAKEWRARR